MEEAKLSQPRPGQAVNENAGESSSSGTQVVKIMHKILACYFCQTKFLILHNCSWHLSLMCFPNCVILQFLTFKSIKII